MNRQKKITILVCVLMTALNTAACGQRKDVEIVDMNEPAASQGESTVQTEERILSETKEPETIDAAEAVISQQADTVQAVENTDSEMTAEELFDLFFNGSINAVDSADLTSTFSITDLDMDSYSVGEQVDLDNDGENELIICGPYGGIYLDARDNKVYQFAAGGGNALMLSYVVYNGATWILYSNRMNAGYEVYHMERFEGADHLTAEMDFGEEPVDENNIASGMKYTRNGAEISYDEYYELGSRIFATEVNTDLTNK